MRSIQPVTSAGQMGPRTSPIWPLQLSAWGKRLTCQGVGHNWAACRCSDRVVYSAGMGGRYFLETFGCQMNERDSETIRGLLEALSYSATDSPQEADIIIFNTCSVREKPHHKVFSRLGDLRAVKAQRPELIIAVCGCMAQIIPDALARRAPFVDIILGPRNIAELPQLIAQRIQSPHADGPAVRADSSVTIAEGLPACRQAGVSAYVNVTYGCNNFCAYCVVPYARGREVSRRVDDILQEVCQVVDVGRVEVTLLGQNVNSYGNDLHEGCDFADLLKKVDAVEGLQRLRFTTSHPKDCSKKLLAAMRDLPTVCEHLHLPLQSGDDEVLRSMRRGYTCAHYRSLVEAARQRVPDIAITADLIVGFPGETEEQFERTLNACREIRFDQAFMFKYNDRPGTAAAAMPHKVPEAVKQKRLERLVALQNEIARDINRALVGQVFEVLVEGPDKKTAGCVRGRTRHNKLMIFPGEPELTGELIDVRADEAFLWGFKGRRV